VRHNLAPFLLFTVGGLGGQSLVQSQTTCIYLPSRDLAQHACSIMVTLLPVLSENDSLPDDDDDHAMMMLGQQCSASADCSKTAVYYSSS
jgi:hypothetical protein